MPTQPDRPTCPRCGTVRLIRRPLLPAAPRLRDGPALWLRWRLQGRRGRVHRTLYVCELCRHQWRVDEIVPAAR